MSTSHKGRVQKETVNRETTDRIDVNALDIKKCELLQYAYGSVNLTHNHNVAICRQNLEVSIEVKID